MDLIKVFVYLAGLISLFAGAVKIDENIKLKREIKELRKKLGKE